MFEGQPSSSGELKCAQKVLFVFYHSLFQAQIVQFVESAALQEESITSGHTDLLRAEKYIKSIEGFTHGYIQTIAKLSYENSTLQKRLTEIQPPIQHFPLYSRADPRGMRYTVPPPNFMQRPPGGSAGPFQGGFANLQPPLQAPPPYVPQGGSRGPVVAPVDPLQVHLDAHLDDGPPGEAV